MHRHIPAALALPLLLLGGCLHCVCDQVDGVVCDLASQPRDLQPVSHADLSPPVSSRPTEDHPGKAKDTKKGEEDGERRLRIPEELMPGGRVPRLDLPPEKEGKDEGRKQAILKLYPDLPPLGSDLPSPPGPEGRPLCLADLQRLALANSPQIKQAAARVEETRGAALQAGLQPNPTVGFEADTIGTTGGAGYVGGFVEQVIKTGNKLHLARAVAEVDVKNAEVALRKAQADLVTQVRAGYFAVLVAQEAVRLNRALVEFTTEAYRVQVEQVVRGGFAAPYEPMYLRALAMQARASLVQARNRRTAAWKQLAANLGLPGMPATELTGRLDIPIPAFEHKAVLARTLLAHTDVMTAENQLIQSKIQLQLERVTPIPDVDVRVMAQKDRTGPPFNVAPSVAVSIPVPVWNRNQGNIHQAEAAVCRQAEEGHRVRTDLTNRLAGAFERYENNRVMIGYYRDQILPDLVRVYRGVHERYQQEPGGAAGSPPTFTDVVVAQQNLAASVATYITTLGGLWQSVVEVADLLQTFDLFGVEQAKHPVAEIPDLKHLRPLPCCHPCSPLPGLHQTVLDGTWPSAEPGVRPTARKEKPTTELPPPRPEKKPVEKKAPEKIDPLLLAPPPRIEASK